MISNDEAIAKFQEIIGSAEGWQDLKDSQFVRHLAVFQAWALRDAQYRVERALQEFFISTALNPSSVMAHAEDRAYIPRPPSPSTGTIRITNTGQNPVSIPIYQAYRSNKAIAYLSMQPVTIAASAYADLPVIQASRQVVSTTVTESKPYLEILFDASLSGSIYRIDVAVNGADWTLARLLQNVGPEDTVYDEVFTHLGQRGIRFGNGIFGRQPQTGDQIVCTLWLTDGPTSLLSGQQLTPTTAISDSTGQSSSLDIRTITAITGGIASEGIDEIKRNLIYWPLYQEQLVWKEDYIYFLKRRFPQIRWINVWGESEAEKAAGEMRFEFINKIFVSAYAYGGEDIESDVMEALAEVKLLNRRFEWVAPDIRTFGVSVIGYVHRKYDASVVRQAVLDALEAAYDIDSETRRSAPVRINDVYMVINDTGYFDDGGYFTAQLTGNYDVTPSLNAVSDIDIDACVVSMGYIA